MRASGLLRAALLSAGIVCGLAAPGFAQPSEAPTPAAVSSSGPSLPPPDETPWCAPGIDALAHDVCYHVPTKAVPEGKHTLLVFLHGVTLPGSGWQHAPQRGLVLRSEHYGITVLMPRGRRGYGPGTMRNWWTWPASVAGQAAVENEVLDEWLAAKKVLEDRAGRPFDKLYIFGFSNGAYYASSLALRGRLPVDGYGIFAGGSAPEQASRWAAGVRPRPPIYVGYGERDATARKDSRTLDKVLRALQWRHRWVGRPRVGHSMTDAQVREALEFFASPGEDHPPARLSPSPSRREHHPRGRSNARSRGAR